MTREEWLKKYQAELGSKYEALFVEHVLPLVVGLRYEALVAQYPFRDSDGRQRYCDFVIQEGDSIRIALEIDGYDKRGTGQGQTQEQFLDDRRREASLVAQGFRVLRFANIDVRDRPSRCADLITLTLKSERERSLLVDAIRSAVRERPEDKPPVAAERSSSRNFVIASLVTLVVVLAMAVVRSGVLAAPAEPTTPTGQFAALLPSGSGRGAQPVSNIMQPLAPEPTCYTVHMVEEGIATCEQEDGSVIRVLATPDMREGTGPWPRAKPLLGSSCKTPLNWDSAREHIGQTRAFAGRLVAVTESPPNTRGAPTWSEVGAPFPNSKRLSLVVWGNRRSSFPTARLQALMGTRVCVVGEVQDYKGVARIELRTTDQLHVQDDD